MIQFKKGDSVAWKWVNGLGEGTVIEVCTEKTKLESKGKLIVRNGSPENPALIIHHNSGNKVLKLASEVQKTN